MSVMIGCSKYGRIPWILRNGWQREENMELEGKALCQRQRDKWSSSDELSLLVFLCPPASSHTGWWISRWFFLFYQFQWNYSRRLSAHMVMNFHPYSYFYPRSPDVLFCPHFYFVLFCSHFIFLPYSFFSVISFHLFSSPVLWITVWRWSGGFVLSYWLCWGKVT